MPDRNPSTYETFDSLTVSPDGEVIFFAASPETDLPGFTGYLVPWYTLSDRGSYFVPGALKKSAKEQLKKAPHLWSHNFWVDEVPIGRHTAAEEDATGFKISVAMDEGVQKGAEVMSALRHGTPLGLSIGFDSIRDRTGNDDEDAKLDRRTAPAHLQTVPINELRAITEAKWWESSSVVWGAIATAKPSEIRSASPDLISQLLQAITAGALTREQELQAAQLVSAWQSRADAAGSGQHLTRDSDGWDITVDYAAFFERLQQEYGEAA